MSIKRLNPSLAVRHESETLWSTKLFAFNAKVLAGLAASSTDFEAALWRSAQPQNPILDPALPASIRLAIVSNSSVHNAKQPSLSI